MVTTDPAEELAAVAKALLAQAPSNKQTGEVLGAIFGVGPVTPEYAEIVAILRRRLVRLVDLATSLPESELPQSLQLQVRAAAHRVGSVLEPLSHAQAWSPVRARIDESDRVSLQFFSLVAKRHRPLRLTTDEEREAALAEFSAQLGDLRRTSSGGWERALLIEGLERLIFSLTHLPFLGHEVVAIELIKVQAQALAAAERHAPEGLVSSGRLYRRIYDAASAFALVFALVSGPDQVWSALENYSKGAAKMFQADGSEPDKPLLAIEGPPRALPAPQDRGSGRKARPAKN